MKQNGLYPKSVCTYVLTYMHFDVLYSYLCTYLFSLRKDELEFSFLDVVIIYWHFEKQL